MNTTRSLIEKPSYPPLPVPETVNEPNVPLGDLNITPSSSLIVANLDSPAGSAK